MFYIIDCQLNDMECAYNWKFRSTYLGRCLELNPNDVLESAKNETVQVQLIGI